MAEEEQKAGNYRTAHDILLATHQQLRERGAKPSEALRSRLSLLHSYTLARLHVRRGEHLMAARLLSRVSANISKFPARKFFCFESSLLMPELWVYEETIQFIYALCQKVKKILTKSFL